MGKKQWLLVTAPMFIIVMGLLVLVFVPSKKIEIPSRPIQFSATFEDIVAVTAPLENARVTSPLTITGKARGMWYFEASAPVELFDGNGQILGTGHITAQGDWMTSNYVPFTATLIFAKPSTKTGTLILKNDNPSGDPGRGKELDIPVTF